MAWPFEADGVNGGCSRKNTAYSGLMIRDSQQSRWCSVNVRL